LPRFGHDVIAWASIERDNGSMSMALQMSAESGVLHVNATGKFSLKEAKRTFIEMIREAVQHKVKKILIDGRDIDGRPEFIERFYFGQFAALTVISHYIERSRTPTFAYVLREPMLDPERFGETVMVNRGMQVRAFDNVAEARTWLGITPAERQ
jgi:hypothetical protein